MARTIGRSKSRQTGDQSDRGQDVELELELQHEPQDASTPDKADVAEETIPAESAELPNASEHAAEPTRCSACRPTHRLIDVPAYC